MRWASGKISKYQAETLSLLVGQTEFPVKNSRESAECKWASDRGWPWIEILRHHSTIYKWPNWQNTGRHTDKIQTNGRQYISGQNYITTREHNPSFSTEPIVHIFCLPRQILPTDTWRCDGITSLTHYMQPIHGGIWTTSFGNCTPLHPSTLCDSGRDAPMTSTLS